MRFGPPGALIGPARLRVSQRVGTVLMVLTKVLAAMVVFLLQGLDAYQVVVLVVLATTIGEAVRWAIRHGPRR